VFTKAEYRNYTSSEQWLARRRAFLSDKTCCNRCQIEIGLAIAAYGQGLHAHHKNYQRVGCELDSDLEALCRRCHEIETFGKTSLPPAHLSLDERLTVRGLIGQEHEETRMTEDGLAGLFGAAL
jgi:5-methylcytosine-specific restriction endonuclease McrA